MCQTFIESFEAKAAQSVPPSKAAGVNGPTSTWLAAAAIARELPDAFSASVHGILSPMPRAMVLEEQHLTFQDVRDVPWIWFEEAEEAHSASKLWTRLTLKDWDPVLIT